MAPRLEGIKTERWPEKVHITDVGPRDGLQNESYLLPTEQKLRLIQGLVDAGVKRVEATSFVHPKVVPQLADAAEVVAGLPQRDDVLFYALIPNEKGYERALASGLEYVGLVLSVTESMNRKNLNMSVAESMAAAKRILGRSRADGVGVRVYISVAFVCPFEGVVQPRVVEECAGALLAMGADEICIADTIGRGNPAQVAALFSSLLAKHDQQKISAHFHNTYGMALANTVAALQQGVIHYDASVGGLGGCPFAPGATGNTPTEDLVNLLHQMGVQTGIDLEKLCDVVDQVESFSGTSPPSAYYRATLDKRTTKAS